MPAAPEIDPDMATLFLDLEACRCLVRTIQRPYLGYLIDIAVLEAALEITGGQLEDIEPDRATRQAERCARAVLAQR